LKSDVRVLVWISSWYSSHSPGGASCTSCSKAIFNTNSSNQVFPWWPQVRAKKFKDFSTTFQGHSSMFSRPISVTFYCDVGILKVIA